MILMIDNYDSFVFNVEQYLKELSCEEVRTVRNDEISIEEIRKLNPRYSNFRNLSGTSGDRICVWCRNKKNGKSNAREVFRN